MGLEPYKNRNVEKGQKVQVYRNLNKPGKWFSVRDAKTKLVLGHTQSICLIAAEFIVQPGGRDRVRRERRKNIHSWVEGWIVPDKEWLKSPRVAMYDPYKFDSFVDGMTWEPVHSSPMVIICGVGVIYAKAN